MRHRGLALKLRALNHILAVMHTYSECAPTGSGMGPKAIGRRAGFDFHSPHKRHYARGLILELVQKGVVEKIPTSPGSSKSKYRIVQNYWTGGPVSLSYLLSLATEGMDIIQAAKNIICDYLLWKKADRHTGTWISSNIMEKDTGLYEGGHPRSGYWAWLVREELDHQGLIETDRRVTRDLQVRLK